MKIRDTTFNDFDFDKCYPGYDEFFEKLLT